MQVQWEIFVFLFLTGTPFKVYGVNLEIDGLIDLGPQWNYSYKISQPKELLKIKKDETSIHELLNPKFQGNYKSAERFFDKKKKRTIPHDTIKKIKGKQRNKIKGNNHYYKVSKKEKNKRATIESNKSDPKHIKHVFWSNPTKIEEKGDSKENIKSKRNHNTKKNKERSENSMKGIKNTYGKIQVMLTSIEKDLVRKRTQTSTKNKSNDKNKSVESHDFNDNKDDDIDEVDEDESKSKQSTKYTNKSIESNYNNTVTKRKRKQNKTKTKDAISKEILIKSDEKKTKTIAFIDNFHKLNKETEFFFGIANKNISDLRSVDNVTEINFLRYSDDLFVKEHRVKDESVIDDFTFHIYKQSLKIFDDVKKKYKDLIPHSKLRQLKKAYKEKFGAFVNETRGHKIKTNLGAQNVITNIIKTSDRMLKNVFNQISEDTVGLFQREIDKQKKIEDQHACYKLGICRSNAVFSDILIYGLTTILDTRDAKFKQATDALTESLKNGNFSSTLDPSIEKRFKNFLNGIESWPPFITRGMLLIIRAVIANKERPIFVFTQNDQKAINKTVAFRELIHMLDDNFSKSIPSTPWESLKQNLLDWKNGKNLNILEIMDKFVKNITELLDKMSLETKQKFNSILKTLGQGFGRKRKRFRLN